MLGSGVLGRSPGGVTEHVECLTKAMAKNENVEIHLLGFAHGVCDVKTSSNNIYRHYINYKSIYKYVPFVSYIKLINQINLIKPDILHLQGQGIGTPQLAFFTYPISSKRKISTTHSLSSAEYECEFPNKAGVGHVFRKYVEHISLRFMRRIIVCSPFTKKLISSKTNASIFIVPNGVDMEWLTEGEKQIDIAHPSILFLGVLRVLKGLYVLLDAFELVLAKVPECRLYVAGDGPEMDRLINEIESRGISDHVTLLGYLDNIAKAEYLKSTDVCVIPSLYEAFGIVVLESMALSKTTVVSDAGGIPYITEGGRYAIQSRCGDHVDLANKILIALENEGDCISISEQGRKRAQEFSWQNAANKTIKIYNGMISCE
jgi:glycosyltransferase involved in cell wall biosynthesis